MGLPTNNDKESKRTDIDQSNGRAWSVNVRPDKVKGGWTVFVKFRRENDTEAKLFMRSIHCKERQDIGKAIAELLRMVDKLGFDSSMAAASRDRNYCNTSRRGA